MAIKEVPNYVDEIRAKLKNDNKYVPQKDLEWAVDVILRHNNCPDWPIDAQKLAENLGFDIYETIFPKGTIGAMVDAGEPIGDIKSLRYILTDKQSDILRKIGTIAHELGHFFIDCDGEHEFYETRPLNLYKIDPQKKIKEENANRFKDALLMPENSLKAFVNGRKGKRWGDVLQEIKYNFVVPSHTARERLEQMMNETINDEDRCRGV